jgi:hypothetical protein
MPRCGGSVWCRVAPGYVRACSDVAAAHCQTEHHRAEMAAAARDACPVLGSDFSHMPKTPDLRRSDYLGSSVYSLTGRSDTARDEQGMCGSHSDLH